MKNLNNIEAVILSVDGLLYDLNTYKQSIYSEVMKQHDLEPHPYFFEILLDGGYQQVERAYIHFNNYRPIRKEMEETFNKRFLEDLENNNLPVVKETFQLIEYLNNSEYKIGLVSSYRKEYVETMLENYPHPLRYDKLVSGNECMEGKPEKDLYTKLHKQLKVIPNNCFAIDTTANGVMGSYLAGMLNAYIEIYSLRIEKVMKYSNYQFPTIERLFDLI